MPATRTYLRWKKAQPQAAPAEPMRQRPRTYQRPDAPTEARDDAVAANIVRMLDPEPLVPAFHKQVSEE